MHVKPNENYKRLFKKLRSGTTEPNRDELSSFVMDLTNDSLYSSSCFIEENFSTLSKEEFNYYYNMFIGIEMISDACFNNLFDFLTVYESTPLVNNGKESINFLLNIVAILEKYNVALPNLSDVEFSSFYQRNGWGDYFDGHKLSIILD